MDVSSTTAAGTSPATKPAATPSNALSSDFDTFLKMLTVQMRNQDPLNPIDSTDFAIQLATFSGVEQQVRTNDLLKSLGEQIGMNGMAQLAGWVGMDARVTAPVAFVGQPIELAPQPDAGADRTELVVRNAAGAEVQRVGLPPTDDLVTWAGTTPSGGPFPTGTYSFELDSFQGQTLLSTSPVAAYGRIAEARLDEGRAVLIMEGGSRVASEDVEGIRLPL